MLCLISLEAQYFALSTAAVREVIASAVIVKVPLAPGFITGVVNHRGVMLTTVSLRSVLGMPPRDSSSRGCVVVMRGPRDGTEGFGLLVDAVTGVLTLDQRVLQTIPATVAETGRRVLRGMYLREQGPLVELDAEALRPERLAAMEHGCN